MTRRSLAAALVAGILVVSAPARAGVEADLIATMKGLGAALASVKAYVEGRGDQPAAASAAGRMVELARTIPTLFPAGHELADLPRKFGDGPATDADWQFFIATQTRLVGETEKLKSLAASGDRAAVEQQVGQTTRTVCAACHDKFRD